jgi:hypothetical protein
MSPVGRLVFKTSEVHRMRLVGSTPTSSANFSSGERDYSAPRSSFAYASVVGASTLI